MVSIIDFNTGLEVVIARFPWASANRVTVQIEAGNGQEFVRFSISELRIALAIRNQRLQSHE
jgi:hypothetical protein